jgi:phosphoglycolate phosphatase/pyrophosphatase PpaX
MNMTRYRCLVLDHDDTAVSSTMQIHYPAFCEMLRKLRPKVSISYEEYYYLCFDPGFDALCRDILGLSDEEMRIQFEDWKRFVSCRVPDFFSGIPEIVRRQQREGGAVCVVSHSFAETIRRDYAAHCGAMPDLVFGWEQGEGRRKPEPWPLEEIMRRLSLPPGELLMVDDLKPGCLMARACGVDFAYAGWAVGDSRIHAVMQQCSDYFLQSPAELSSLLF